MCVWCENRDSSESVGKNLLDCAIQLSMQFVMAHPNIYLDTLNQIKQIIIVVKFHSQSLKQINHKYFLGIFL